MKNIYNKKLIKCLINLVRKNMYLVNLKVIYKFKTHIKEEDPIPKVNFKPPPVVPKEAYGVGVNKYVYYVCNARKFVFSIKL